MFKIFAIEFTNFCNAKCIFCPHPTDLHTRQKGHLTIKTMEAIIKNMSNKRVAINGLGEPLMNPDAFKLLGMLADAGKEILFNTNGKLLTQENYDKLAALGAVKKIPVNAEYFKWKNTLKEQPHCNVYSMVFYDEPDEDQFKKQVIDWGGTVGAKDPRPYLGCSFLEDNWYQVMYDGSVIRCCIDYNSKYKQGNIHEPEKIISEKTIPLCKNCKGYIFKDPFVVGNYDGQGEDILA